MVKHARPTIVLAAAAAAAVLLATVRCDTPARECTEAEAKASALIAEVSACTPGDPCEVFPIRQSFGPQGACLLPFLCSVGITAGTDRASLVARARAIVDGRNCTSCAIAKCRADDTLEAYCDEPSRRCTLRVRP
jgi:hypothetical protein